LNLIEFRRAMCCRGWAYRRRRKGEMVFGTRFPNGKGVTRVISTAMAGLISFPPQEFAKLLSQLAAHDVGFDPRRIA